jgi:hypothetical protein
MERADERRLDDLQFGMPVHEISNGILHVRSPVSRARTPNIAIVYEQMRIYILDVSTTIVLELCHRLSCRLARPH